LKACRSGKTPKLGKNVAIIGGGNAAIDAARTALRQGANVTVVYRRNREEMPAIAAEVEEAVKEGVQFRFLARPKKIEGKNNKVDSLVCE
jgi:heterodisulfide reductase subunit A